MPAEAHVYYLGKNASFAFSGGIANKDVKSVSVTRETTAEVNVTTRGSGDEDEFAFARSATSIEVVCLDHDCAMGSTGSVTMTLTPAGGPTQPTGSFQVMNIAESQDLDNAVEWTISLKKTVTAAATGA
jgi:hypothetical protein